MPAALSGPTPLRAALRAAAVMVAATAMLAGGSRVVAAQPARVRVTVRSSGSGARLRQGFIGLGVVADTLASGQFAHTDLPAYLRLLGPDGTLRIGGNRVDSFWTSTGQPAPAWSHGGEVTPADLRGLAGAVRGTGWHVILGVPIEHTPPARDAQEARFAARILGSALRAIEVGNEPNLYGISPSAYFADFHRRAAAIHRAVPRIEIAGPAMGRARPRWVAAFTRDELPRPDIDLLTTHEYPLSVCNGQHPTIADLLSSAVVRHELEAAHIAASAARRLGVPAAIDETNSAICWGAPGVSNVYASSLWILDYGLLLASHGISAANFQTRIAGCTPYIPLCTRPHSTRLYARPELYGLLALRQLGTGAFLGVENPDPLRLRAYAVRNGPGRLSLALDNLGAATSVTVRLPRGMHLTRARRTLLRTISPRGLAATSGIRLGGARVGADARFPAPRYATVRFSGATLALHLEAHTAAIVTLT